MLKTSHDKTDDTFMLLKENSVTQTQIVPYTFHPHYQVTLPRSSGDILIYHGADWIHLTFDENLKFKYQKEKKNIFLRPPVS